MTLRARSMLAVVAAVAAGALPGMADVTDFYRFTLRTQQSSVMTDLTAAAQMTGTLVGNFDAKANPTGTRTIPGLIGGSTSGNTPIPFMGAAGFTGTDTSHPAGGFNLALDLEAGTASVSGLVLDLTNGQDLGVTFGLTIEYSSFRTRQPTATYIGGIPIPIPFGQVSLSGLLLTQTSTTGAGVLQETGPGMYTVTLIAPVELTGSLLAPGQPLEIGPVVVPLVVTMSVSLAGESAAATLGFDESFLQSIPLSVDLPADQAIDLPTILPPGETAHLLLNASLSSLDIDFNIAAAIGADGARMTFSRADWNRDGVVNSVDFFAFVMEFMTVGVDFNADGLVNSQDYFDFLTVFFEAR